MLARFFNLLLLCSGLQAQSIFVNGSFSNIVTPGGTPSGGGGGGSPGDGYEANLYAYYAMEDANATSTGIADSTSSHRTLHYFSGPNATASGIIGQAFNFDSLEVKYPASSTSTDFLFHAAAFTIRFWIKTSETDGFNDFMFGFNGVPWGFYLGTPPSGGDTKVDFEVTDSGTTYDLTSGTSIGDGSWHRIVAWCDNAGTIGIQVDNNTPATQTGVGTLLDFGASSWTLGHFATGTEVDIDELAFWSGYVLTSSDRTFDWNSGAGETYPLP